MNVCDRPWWHTKSLELSMGTYREYIENLKN